MAIRDFFYKLNFIHFIAIFLVIIWLANLAINTTTKTDTAKEIESINWISESLDLLLPPDVKKDKTNEFQYLFLKFDLNTIEWKKIVTTYKQGIKKYLTLYEIDWWIDSYLKIKNVASKNIELDENMSLFEANNLWAYSAYFNDNNKKNTVFLLSLIWSKVIAFEYPRDKHEELEVFKKALVKQY